MSTTAEFPVLYQRGNLFRGYPFGIEGVGAFGSAVLFGPFSSAIEARNTMIGIAKADVERRFESLKVVKIETPQSGEILVRDETAEHGWNEL